MSKEEVKVIGIDPAPSKRSTVFDGEKFDDKDFRELARYIHGVKGNSNKVLIGWDAPLMDMNLERKDVGEKDGDDKQKAPKAQVPYFRKIDKELKEDIYNGNSKDHGASVLPFAACPHWTVSRFVLGLPSIGPYDKEEIPYDLLTDDKKGREVFEEEKASAVAEVHPAVAMYYWLDGDLKPYKDSKENVMEIWRALNDKVDLPPTECSVQEKLEASSKASSDDLLDAFVAWALGKLWLEGNGKVVLKGDGQGSGMLLPQKG